MVDRKQNRLHPSINANSVYKPKNIVNGICLLHFDCSINNSDKMIPHLLILGIIMAYGPSLNF
jgi:hypothetical protein